MNPLASIFRASVAARNLLYDREWIGARRLKGPVISIGNLSVGGSGKTPFVIMLGEMLKSRGIRFDVLSRGYGRRSRGVLSVQPNGSSAEFGDEPVLIAKKLDVPVIVGEERYDAGIFAEQKFGAQLHVLDDGFQHRALARDFDIVLVASEDATDRMLPAGRLREPISSLRRADAIVLTGGTLAASLPTQEKLLWTVRRRITPQMVPSRPVAFCGIARPDKFLSELRTAGIEPVAEAVFRDHHRYTEKDILDLLQLKQSSEAGGFVTTEKDLVNLGEYVYRLQLLSAIPVKMELADASDHVDTMLRIVEERMRKREKIVGTAT